LSSDQLWAPWRLSYIKGEETSPACEAPDWLPGADSSCFICRAVAESRDRENLLVHRGREVVTLLNRYPYNNGHLLIAPRLHKATLAALTNDEHLESQQVIVCFVDLLQRLMNAEGFNIGLNLGRLAGAGLPGHVHWHIVPRWNGDTNFMPTVAGTKVIPQSLDSLWGLLYQAEEARPDSQKAP
jgi:ATP adenylyltransferase